MPDEGPPQRLNEIFTALVQRSIADSLAGWRRGDRNVLAAHAEVLRHAARTNVLSNRIARAALEGPDTLLRDALDAGVIDRDEAQRLLGRDPEGVAPSPSLDEEAARTASPEMPAKRSTMEKLLRDGPVLVHLDPRRPGVDVPAQHRGEPRLVLRFGFGLTPPIADLAVEEHALSGTLTFRGVPHRCIVPWTSVFAVVGEDGRGLVWGEDVPVEISHEYARDAKATTSAKPEKPERPPRPRKTEEPPEPPEPTEPTKPRRGHLKLV